MECNIQYQTTVYIPQIRRNTEKKKNNFLQKYNNSEITRDVSQDVSSNQFLFSLF